MSIIQRYADWLRKEANHRQPTSPTKAEVLRCIAERLEALEKDNNRLRGDEARLDWLADKNNTIGNVELPQQCVIKHLDSLRDAIDDAMNLEAE